MRLFPGAPIEDLVGATSAPRFPPCHSPPSRLPGYWAGDTFLPVESSRVTHFSFQGRAGESQQASSVCFPVLPSPHVTW